jgi:hypothetical protein
VEKDVMMMMMTTTMMIMIPMMVIVTISENLDLVRVTKPTANQLLSQELQRALL